MDLDGGVVHVWRSASRSGDTRTPKSRRSLIMPKRAVDALTDHRKLQAAERLEAGAAWHDTNLAFCYENGQPYSRWALNWRFSQMTQRAGIGHWHAYERRHTAVPMSIMSSNGVPIQDIVPAIRGGATVMDSVFGDQSHH